METVKWKTPVWKVSPAQVIRILRVAEMRAILNDVRATDQGLIDNIRPEFTSTDARRWLQASLFTGCRFTEIWRLHDHPELMQENGTIRLDKSIFYDLGKHKQVAQERVVFLSDAGRDFMPKFFQARTPKLNNNSMSILETVDRALSAMMDAAAIRVGLQARAFSRTLHRAVKDEEGVQQYDDSGKKIMRKENVQQKPTTGVRVRSLRKSWESWLISSRGADEFMVRNICMSMGHTREIAMKHYFASQFDDEDIAEMLAITEGYGIKRERAAVMPAHSEEKVPE